jgi:small-conductance mechanosensitive channel
VFIPNIDYFLKTRHELHKAIDAKFRAAGVEIAFPQRDIHVRTIHQALPLAREQEPSVVEEMHAGRTDQQRP